MGLTLEFYLGDAKAISDAVEDVDLEKLSALSMINGMADFSLHIVPDDLDLLSREFAHESGQCAMELGPHLEALFDDIDRGAFQVDDHWVSYAAAVPKAAARSITQRWFDKMGQKYNDARIEITKAGVKAVDDLLELCKRAKREGQTVLYVWFG